MSLFQGPNVRFGGTAKIVITKLGSETRHIPAAATAALELLVLLVVGLPRLWLYLISWR